MKKRTSKWLLPIGHFDRRTQQERRAMGHSVDVDRPRKLHWRVGRLELLCGLDPLRSDFTDDAETWKMSDKRCSRCERKKIAE